MDQHREQARFADKQLLAPLAICTEPSGATLVGIEFQSSSLIERPAHEAGGVLEAKPGLAVEHKGAELALGRPLFPLLTSPPPRRHSRFTIHVFLTNRPKIELTITSERPSRFRPISLSRCVPSAVKNSNSPQSKRCSTNISSWLNGGS